MPSLNCRNGLRKFWRYTKLNLISSIWFWLGLLGVSVVTYGVFDALNTQAEKSVSGVDIQNVQEQTQVEINEATKEAEVIPVEVFLDTARVDVDGLVTLAGRAEPGATIEAVSYTHLTLPPILLV